MDRTPATYQVSGMLMVVSGLFNLFLASIWFLALVWVCVGVLWLIPVMVAFAEVGVGILVLTGARVPGVQLVSVLGMLNSMFLCNIWAALFEGVAAVLQFQPDVREYLEG